MTTNYLFDDRLSLKILTEADSLFFYNMYSRPELLKSLGGSPFLKGETPEQFTTRIISSCEFIWTIRNVDNPESIIGDCALHHWNQDKAEIEIGGSLLPEYWGQAIMQAAFGLLIDFARRQLKVKAILGQTKPLNIKAVRLAEKMGFGKVSITESDVFMKR